MIKKIFIFFFFLSLILGTLTAMILSPMLDGSTQPWRLKEHTLALAKDVPVEEEAAPMGGVSNAFGENRENLMSDHEAITEKGTISNEYLLLVGRMYRRPVRLFLSIQKQGEDTRVHGLFLPGRNTPTSELVGGAEDGTLVLQERIWENGEPVLRGSWSLRPQEQEGGTWRGNFPQGRINFQEDNTPYPQKFVYQGRSIHPQVIGYLFERINGSPLSVNIQNYSSRPYASDGEWQQASLEYGYVRYRVLTNWRHSWILETERSPGRSDPSTREIIHTVWTGNYLTLLRIVDQGVGSQSPIAEIRVADKIHYTRKVTGRALKNYLEDFNMENLFPVLVTSDDDSGDDLDVASPAPGDWCESCSHAVITLTYDLEKYHRQVESLELIPGQDFSDANDKIETGFQQALSRYLNRGMRRLEGDGIKGFIDSWLKGIL